MVRAVVCGLAALALLFSGAVLAADKGKGKAGNNQMVKGTIKSVDAEAGVLVVLQKVKNETVERQLDIKDNTEFIIATGTDTKEVLGKAGLSQPEVKEG